MVDYISRPSGRVAVLCALAVGACTKGIEPSALTNTSTIRTTNGVSSLCAGEDPLAGCGESCSGGDDCALGLFCNAESSCDAECEAFGPEQCVEGFSCSAEGRCVEVVSTFSGELDPTSSVPESCASVSIDVDPIVPRVQLVLDRSGSMTFDLEGRSSSDPDYDGTRRWEHLGDLLYGTVAQPNNGLVDSLEGLIPFGATYYSYPYFYQFACVDSPSPPGVPVTHQPPALNNESKLYNDYLATAPGGATPTAPTLEWVAGELAAALSDDPAAMILATDGLSNGCEYDSLGVLTPENRALANADVVSAVREAYDNYGIRTYVLFIGPADNEVVAHIQRVANVGVGLDQDAASNEAARYGVATDVGTLESALRASIEDAVGCSVALQGEVDPAQANRGTVRLNGSTLNFESQNGWRLIDGSTIELLGNSCREVTSGGPVNLQADFPCDAIVSVL